MTVTVTRPVLRASDRRRDPASAPAPSFKVRRDVPDCERVGWGSLSACSSRLLGAGQHSRSSRGCPSGDQPPPLEGLQHLSVGQGAAASELAKVRPAPTLLPAQCTTAAQKDACDTRTEGANGLLRSLLLHRRGLRPGEELWLPQRHTRDSWQGHE